MIGDAWNLILINPLLNLLMLFYKTLGYNMGLAIIALSLAVKVATFPFMQSSLQAMKKQKELMPELEKLKKKFGHDKNKLAMEQMALYKREGVNPASGCLTQIFPFLIIIALFGVINLIFSQDGSISDLNSRMYLDYLRLPVDAVINARFLYLDLAKPDHFYILPALSGIAQFVVGKMMIPAVKKAEVLAKKADDSMENVMYNMQEQMLYMAPVMSFIIGLRLPSGVVLNILITTLFSIGQQYFVSGFGSLETMFRRVRK